MQTVAALYIDPRGPYPKMPGVDAWDEKRDARKYGGPWPVVAHPPCQRWGRYWSGGPSASLRRKLGDDDGCFFRALSAVRRYGGVLEHPEASHAFAAHGLTKPAWRGGWVPAGDGIGHVCCVAQGHFGHRARKLTWLYAVGTELPELDWSIPAPRARLDSGYHSSAERAENRTMANSDVRRLSHAERLHTPGAFAELLIRLARSVKGNP